MRAIRFLTPTISERSNHQPHIDGLRGIAILSVILFHSYLHIGNSLTFIETKHFAETLARGVQLFFIVSGYTLFFAAYGRDETTMKSAMKFYARRAFRILPLWWLICVYYWIFLGRSGIDMLTSATFLVGFYKNAYLECVTPVGWSLFVEEGFYLFFPIWIALIVSTPRAFIALGFIFLISPHIAALVPNDPKLQSNFVQSLVWNYFCFFIGTCVWFLSNEARYQQLTRLPFVRIGLDVLALACAIGVFFVSWKFGSFLLGVVVLAAMTPGTVTRRLCSTKFLVTAGGLCYGLYLIHNIVESQVTYKFQYHLRGKISGEIEMLIQFAVTIAITLPVAYMVFTYFEKPIVRLGRNWISKKWPAPHR